MNNLTLIIPAKQEAESLPIVLSEIEQIACKKIVILEESDKETINSINDFNCEIIFQNNKGYGDALIKGIENVKTEYLCIYNADGSFDPKYLSKKLEMCKKMNMFFHQDI